jgi:hypothetical protein
MIVVLSPPPPLLSRLHRQERLRHRIRF